MKRVLLLFVLLLMVGFQAFAQTHQVVGKVLDETGQGFPGAGVSVKGTAIGTVTDVNGSFTLDVPDGTKSLTIQAVGYTSQDVAITGESMLVHLKVTSRELEGTVVTALAVKREKRELGYASTTLSNQDLTNGNNTSALSALEGKVAGANITSSTGGPGGSTRVVLRGEKSFNGNNNALIIIDGVITNNFDRTQTNQLEQIDFGNSANDIDPDDIESVTVLNGAQAAALYGSIGANGAIMYTTKSGKSRNNTNKKLEITYKATYTQSDILKYMDLQHQFGQGNIYQGIADDRRENFSWGLPFDNQPRPWGQQINGQQLVKPYSDQPDNIKSFFNHGKDLNNYLSLAGGTETSSYFLSINSLNSTGVVPNTFYDKYSIRFNGSTELGNNFYSSININYINNYSKSPNSGQNIGSVLGNLYQTARDIPTWELKQLGNQFYSMAFPDSSGVTRYGYYGAYYKNPYWVAQNFSNIDRTDRVLGDITLGYKKGKFDVFNRLGADISSDSRYFQSPAFNSQPVETAFYGGDNYVSPGGYSENYAKSMHMNNDLIGRFTQAFNQDFGMTLLGGANAKFYQDRGLFSSIDPKTNGLVIPGYYNFQNAQGPILVQNTLTDTRSFGLYGDLSLNYRKEIFIDATARNDWSSTLETGNNSIFYPSVSGSWVFTERLKGKVKDNILNFGKLRAGYAGIGNSAPAYANQPAGYVQGSVASAFGTVIFPFNNVPGYQISSTVGTPALKPEFTKTFEIGTDLSFFRDKVSFSFTYYDAQTSNQIDAVPLPASSGFSFETINVGNISNKGEEITARVTPISTKSGLRVTLFGTYTHNVSEVTGLTGGASQVSLGGLNGMAIVAAEGHPYGEFYGTDFQKTPDGHVIVDPTTGLPLIGTKSTFEGSYQPKFIASFGADITYKGFRLHVLFNDKQGGVFYSQDKVNADFNGTTSETGYNNRQPYVWANSVNATTSSTGVVTYTTNTTKFVPYNYYTNVEQFVPAAGLVNASYVKLQEASLYYSIPNRYYKRSPFGSLEVGVFGTNLILWTAKSNKYNDPEETSAGAAGNGQGFNFTANPSLRNYGVTLKATF